MEISQNRVSRVSNTEKTIFTAIITVMAVILFLMMYYNVQQYERVVLTRFGKVVEVAEPGLHFKVPFVHSIHRIRTDIQNVTMPEDGKGKQITANTYTVDNQEVDIVFNLFYRVPVDKVAFVYENVQDYQGRLYNMAVDRLKSEMGKVNATHVAEQRGKIRDAITKVLEKDAQELGLVVVDFQLTNVDYTKSFRTAVEAAASAKANVETREQERVQAIKVAEAKVIAAKGVGDAAREQAKGEADGIRLRGEAQAAAIKAQAEALASNSKLVELRKAERWDGKLPVQMLSGVVPFMQFQAPDGK